ncbi:two-component sensor histidine kinase [Pandoraea nosoerga]|uniref:histidine kinase n=1 Tax=Pandoraea nosoerga TaxID=2508296 RepID=A0A5E4WDL5_9BURK|nr:ATP-binding protein [Pandoraea nosoerga]MBN4667807.1 two-component sensor histidine kinase [Pandoraea nosoerga]MBN4675539.1 two-component sensor histidine kinase [Pandoraea nosoerga]MBN4682632.1 two-component sensor histidine kinase [Pandoraea nosoerga]MBN4746875.1 two-component sensor histidine kinase [Pandoraea nosoerga]VVE23187.1 Sensor protein RstB [Pandoraea nosoerga]
MFRILLKLYALVGVSVVAAILLITHTFGTVFYDTMNRAAQAQLGGYAWLINRALGEIPEADWPAFVAEFGARGNDTLEIRPLKDFPLPRESVRKDLEAGLPVANDTDGDHYAMRLRDSQWVLTSTTGTDLSLKQINYLAYALLALLMLIAVLTWVRWYWTDVQALNRAARRFGEGDFSARARVSRFSNLSALVRVFNTMADRIEHSIKTQKDMINAVSHELRTPIARLDFGLEILQQRRHLPDGEERINALKGDIRELDELVTELLSLARLDQITAPPTRHTVSLRLMFDSLAANCTEVLAARSITLDIAAEPGADCVQVEPKLLARAVQNLLNNAMRHTTRRIVCGAKTCESGEIMIYVDDDGEGVPPPERTRIFEPFHRLDSSRNRATGGFGLGLAIVRRIALLHGARVGVDTSPLGGARFTITLPGTPAA